MILIRNHIRVSPGTQSSATVQEDTAVMTRRYAPEADSLSKLRSELQHYHLHDEC